MEKLRFSRHWTFCWWMCVWLRVCVCVCILAVILPTFGLFLRVNFPNAEAVVCEKALQLLQGNGLPRQVDRIVCFTERTQIKWFTDWNWRKKEHFYLMLIICCGLLLTSYLPTKAVDKYGTGWTQKLKLCKFDGYPPVEIMSVSLVMALPFGAIIKNAYWRWKGLNINEKTGRKANKRGKNYTFAYDIVPLRFIFIFIPNLNCP